MLLPPHLTRGHTVQDCITAPNNLDRGSEGSSQAGTLPSLTTGDSSRWLEAKGARKGLQWLETGTEN